MTNVCNHDFRRIQMEQVIQWCAFKKPDPDPTGATHDCQEVSYVCDRCGICICDTCFADLTGDSASAQIDTILKPRVWHIKDTDKPSDALYIGRAGKGQTGVWGNPFSLTRPLTKRDVAKIAERMPHLAELEYARVGNRLTRAQSLELHRGYFIWAVENKKLDVLELVRETEDGFIPRHTMCFCAPQPCHGDLIFEFTVSYCFYRNERGEDHEMAVKSALCIIKREKEGQT